MISRLHYVGATHKSAALAVREQLTAGPDRVIDLLSRLGTIAEERVVVSTCGRFEIYLVQDAEPHFDWLSRLSGVVGLSPDTLQRHVELLSGEAAARRALRVAGGLESKIIGEHQILGQVRGAFEAAHLAGAAGPLLSTLFRSAIHAGKRVRSETSLGRLARSYAALAVDLVQQSLGSVTNKSVAVFGTGAMAREAAARLATTSSDNLIIISGHADRAAALAGELRCRHCTTDALPTVLTEIDAMICCTASRWGLVELHLARRTAAKPLTLIDLGMPRNVDPAVGMLPGVRLMDLDRIPEAAAPHRESIARAEQIVESELARVLKWAREREAAAAIARLAQPQADRSRRREIHRAILQLKEGAAA
ncbi:MAG TPA: glutamyl-tRNA reductase [Phycisphaerae bacterium]|nr:glutamyl-tRNA reductase [Phycisphaerae bacterium]